MKVVGWSSGLHFYSVVNSCVIFPTFPTCMLSPHLVHIFVCVHHLVFISHLLTVKCKHDVVFLFAQLPSPPEEHDPTPPSKDKDSSNNKKPPGKGKAAAGSQQVDVEQVSSR